MFEKKVPKKTVSPCKNVGRRGQDTFEPAPKGIYLAGASLKRALDRKPRQG